jgi:5-hydroxyisourate hydrolase-like protein (transthyretin family)
MIRSLINAALLLAPALPLLFASPARSQTPVGSATTAALAQDLNDYGRRHLQEKLYVQTDKEFYLSGEICWFKLYVVNAATNRPLDLSKVAYLEWLDKDNKPILQAKAGLSKGFGDGSAYLPLTLRSGTYKLRAYTNWMKNDGADWFFEKTITIVNARRSAELSTVPDSLYYPVSFFPEGGNFIENLACKMGFRITDQYGRGVSCSGVVTEDDQDTVARFQPYRFGIGNFMLTARTGHRYRAIFRLADGTAIPTLLPTAAKEGVAMSVTADGPDRWRVNVQASPGAASSGAATAGAVLSGEIYLLAHSRQQVRLAAAGTLTDGKASFVVDKQTLAPGVSTLTLFNAAKQPLCERLVFRQPAHPLQITIQPDKQQYGTRQKIDLAVNTSGDTSASQCSLSVFRVDALQTAPESRIENYLWLASDLKGKIESAEYYFEHPEDEQAIDNLLLTHGWRRFHWGDVQSHGAPLFEFPPEYNGTIVTAKLTDTHTGGPGKGIQAYLSVPGTRTQFTTAYSDDEGRVRFELKDFYGGQEIILQTNPRDSFYRIESLSPWAETYTNDRPITPYRLPKLDSGMLSDRDVALQVLNRYGAERLKQFHLPGIADTTPFYYRPDYSYMLDDYTRFTTMEEVMREYVVMMLVQRKSSHYHLPLFEFPYNQFFDSDPLILLDGVPIFNIDSLMVLDPLKVKRLQTVHRKYFTGSTYSSGILNWTTYKGDLGGYILDPHSTVVDYEGLAMAREFYDPVYPTPEAAATHLPDFRNVLYWAPTVPMGPGNKGALSFYTSDLPGKYIVVAAGLTADGSAGTGIASFEVK